MVVTIRVMVDVILAVAKVVNPIVLLVVRNHLMVVAIVSGVRDIVGVLVVEYAVAVVKEVVEIPIICRM